MAPVRVQRQAAVARAVPRWRSRLPSGCAPRPHCGPFRAGRNGPARWRAALRGRRGADAAAPSSALSPPRRTRAEPDPRDGKPCEDPARSGLGIAGPKGYAQGHCGRPCSGRGRRRSRQPLTGPDGSHRMPPNLSRWCGESRSRLRSRHGGASGVAPYVPRGGQSAAPHALSWGAFGSHQSLPRVGAQAVRRPTAGSAGTDPNCRWRTCPGAVPATRRHVRDAGAPP